jgi:hypothetical protein
VYFCALSLPAYLNNLEFTGIRIPSVYNENGIRILYTFVSILYTVHIPFSLYTLGIRMPSVYQRTLE